jgi:hypothetical protein
MPAKAGIYDFRVSQQRKPWIPAFAGMTTCAAPVGQFFGYPVLIYNPIARLPDFFIALGRVLCRRSWALARTTRCRE